MPNGSYYPLTTTYRNTKYLYTWKITLPSAGQWRLTTSSEIYDVQIQAKTNLSCSSTLQMQMEANTDSTGYTQLTTEPIFNSNPFVQTICENVQFSTVNISLIDQSGRIISTYSPNQTDALGALTPIQIPEQRFRILTTVQLSDGRFIQRMEKQLFSPTIYSIELRDRPRLLQPGQTINFTYLIKSAKSGTHTVRFQIIDILNLLTEDVIEKDLTFVNETSGIQKVTLTNNYESTLTTNLITFSVSTFDNQAQKYLYENDETASLYLDIDSSTTNLQTNYFLTIFFIFHALNKLL